MACTPSAGNQLPGELNLTIYQGSTFYLVITITDENSDPVDFTGCSAAMTVKAGTIAVIELTTDNGRITLGGAAGTITLEIDAEDTAELLPANCKYDLVVTCGDFVTPYLAGLLNVREGVTV